MKEKKKRVNVTDRYLIFSIIVFVIEDLTSNGSRRINSSVYHLDEIEENRWMIEKDFSKEKKTKENIRETQGCWKT